MSQPDPAHPSHVIVKETVRKQVGSSLLEAALMLLVGFVFFGSPQLLSDAGLADYAAAAMVWTFRCGGIAMLSVALVMAIGWRSALWFDAVVSVIVGVMFVVSGAALLSQSDLVGLLVMIFGIMSFQGAHASWTSFRMTAPSLAAAADADAELDAYPSVPAPAPARDGTAAEADAYPSVPAPARPDPAPDPPPAEPPPADAPQAEQPPDGFLADLGRDKD